MMQTSLKGLGEMRRGREGQEREKAKVPKIMTASVNQGRSCKSRKD